MARIKKYVTGVSPVPCGDKKGVFLDGHKSLFFAMALSPCLRPMAGSHRIDFGVGDVSIFQALFAEDSTVAELRFRTLLRRVIELSSSPC